MYDDKLLNFTAKQLVLSMKVNTMGIDDSLIVHDAPLEYTEKNHVTVTTDPNTDRMIMTKIGEEPSNCKEFDELFCDEQYTTMGELHPDSIISYHDGKRYISKIVHYGMFANDDKSVLQPELFGIAKVKHGYSLMSKSSDGTWRVIKDYNMNDLVHSTVDPVTKIDVQSEVAKKSNRSNLH